jgi:ABC-type lipoprotein release transport system permease subunit
LGPNYRLDYAVVRVRPGASATAIAHEAQRLARRFPPLAKEIDIGNEADQAAKIERAIRPQAAALAIFALLAALAALVVVGQVAARELFVSSVDFPTLRAIGATRAQLLAIMLLEVLAAAIVGVALAVLVAIVASPLVLFGPARVSEPHPGIAADWTVLGVGAIAIVVLLVARAAWSAWRLSGASTDPQRASTGAAMRSSRAARTAARTPAPVSTVIGIRLALEPGRGRTAIPVRSALVGSVIAAAAVAAALTFGSNLAQLVRTPRLYGQTWDVAIDTQFGSPPTQAFEQLIGKHPGVDRWSFGDYATLQVGGHTIPGIGIFPGRGEPLFPTVLQGRAPRAEDEVALGSTTLRQLDARVGETIDASIAGNAVRLRVVGRAVFPAFGQGSFNPTGLGDGAALWGPLVARLGPPLDAGGARPGTANFALVHVAVGGHHSSDVSALLADVNRSGKCLVGQCALLTAQRPADIRDYAAVEAAPLALAALLGLLAIASIGHVLVTSISRRRRELAVLMSLGFTRRQVSAAVAWQAVTLAVVTLAIGLPLGAVAGRWIWIAFSTHLNAVPSVHVPLTPVFLMIPSALVIAILLAVGPAWSTHRLHPAALLRTE